MPTMTISFASLAAILWAGMMLVSGSIRFLPARIGGPITPPEDRSLAGPSTTSEVPAAVPASRAMGAYYDPISGRVVAFAARS